MRGIEAGKLDQQLVIVRRVMGTDAAGQEVELSRSDLSPVHWAEIKAIRGAEVDFVNRVSAHFVYNARLRDPIDVVETDLARWVETGEEFEIGEILRPPREGFVFIVLKKVA